MKNYLYTLLLTLVIASPTIARAEAPHIAAAKELVKKVGTEIIAASRTENTNGKNVAKALQPHMDMNAMAQYSLGKMLRTDPTNKEKIASLFATYTMQEIGKRFGGDEIRTVAIGDVKQQPNGGYIVKSQIQYSNKDTIEINFRLAKALPVPTKINDIIFDGLSQVTHNRGTFERAGLTTSDGLIKKLRHLIGEEPPARPAFPAAPATGNASPAG